MSQRLWIKPVTKVGSYSLKQVNQNVMFQVIGAASPTPCTVTSTGNPITAGSWIHVAGWYDGLSVSLSIDGVLRATASCTNGPVAASPAGPFHVGGIFTAPSTVTEPYSGRIDEVRVRMDAAQRYGPRINHKQQSWTGSTTGTANVWTTLPGSSMTMTTFGAPLLVNLNVFVNGGSAITCQTLIDGVWAGSYGGLPNPGDPFWKEGVVYSGNVNWHPWTTSRVYPGVPAGTHTFVVQCATDGGTAGYCNASSVSCSMNVIELN